jgi:exonuclease SbcC
MRLHRLEIQAFGPFADRQSVDFDALSSQGLFLLNGPTGAGKSSVLDAVCFALYGSVPGARQAAKRLRSDHAAASVAPEVSLEFSAGGRRFRVVRSPAWDRPSRRGSGTTPEQARTLLSERVGAEWVQKSARNDEAGHELQALLGMDKEQFTKVVMLPQGEFAAFLRADAKPRRELLQKLFSTTRFEELEGLLAEQSLRAARQLAEQEGHQRNLFLRAIDEAERHDLGAAELGVDPGSSEDWAGSMQVILAALTERRDACVLESTELAERSALADGAVAELRRRRERFDALERVRGLQVLHEEREADAARLSAQLRRHEQARGLATVLQLEDEAESAGDRARRRYREAVELLTSDTTAPDFIPADAYRDDIAREDLVAACAASSSALGVLRAALPDERLLLDVRDGLRTTRVEIESLDQHLISVDAEVSGLQRKQAADALSLADERQAADGLTHLQTEFDAAEAAERTVGRYLLAEQRRVAADGEYVGASERFLELKEQWLAKLQVRLEQAAEELAEGLVGGEPCPVCGSPDHPAPVTSPGGERVTLEEEQEARRLQTEAESALHNAREMRDAARLEAADLAARGGALKPSEAAAATRTARSKLDAAEAAQARSIVLEERMRRAMDEEKRRCVVRDGLRDSSASAVARLSSLTEQETALSQRLAGLQGDAPTLTARIDEVQGAYDHLEAVRDALDGLRQAARGQEDSAVRVRAALRETPFDSAEEARAALLPDEIHVRQVDELAEHEARAHRLSAAWADEAVQETLREQQNGMEPPDDEDQRLAGVSADDLRARAQKAGIGAEVLGHSVAQLEAYARKLADLDRTIAPLRERARLVAGVAETARGGGENLYKMTLATYVLASRLEQVAEAATERLLQMSDGRYALVHSDATAGNKRSGLGLNVIDGWTGNRRDTSTLSGGESFMASLALALGLADVVQQESGGLDIETLFVDEGFGSLDDQALEQVMDALEGLRSGGRVVGLVSHVPELKQRVGAQLQVVKGRQGSSLHFVAQPASV